MRKVKRKCSRCQKTKVVYEDKLDSSGFYKSDSPFGKYFKPGEIVLCDDCMWHDDGYLKDYPWIKT
jgi:hypothetical protein